MAINPSRIFENELQARGLRATNAAGWAAAGIDTVTDELIRAGFTEIGRLIGQSGITNRAVIFQILCAALAKLGEYPIAGKLIAETIDDMNLPWLEFAVRAIAGAGVGGGPHVRVFNKDGRVINPGFFAYDENFRGGVNVACADVNGDGIDYIVTGPGLGGDPEIRVFDKDGTMLIEPFMAYESSEKKGIEVSTADLDDDGIFEIIALTREVFTLF